MPQLVIEIPAPAGLTIGLAVAMYIVARAFRLVWPIVNEKAARRLATIRGSRSAHKRK
jgi:hypothetical protein